MNDYDFFFLLSVCANWAQLQSYDILLHDFNNNDLMRYLEHQDQLLDKIIEQNNTIINQNQEILNLLKGGNE